MQGPSPLIILFVLFHPTSPRSINIGTENSTDIRTNFGGLLIDTTNLEDTMNALNALSVSQKQLLEQQRARHEQILLQHREEEEREAARSTALEAEQKMLEEIRGRVYRKIKTLNKNTNQNGLAQGETTLTDTPKDCSDVYLEGGEDSGVYRIWPIWNRDSKGFLVYCDMETDGGGWTVIHRWSHPGVPGNYFHKTWKEYKNGFGDLESAFWLGNERIYELTSQGTYELRIDMENSSSKSYSTYGSFFIGSEDVHYKLHAGNYRADGKGDDIFHTINKANFSTYDRNNMRPNKREETGYPIRYVNVKPKCTENDVGWWHVSSCKVDVKIHPITDSKTEMKIRHISFTKKKESPP